MLWPSVRPMPLGVAPILPGCRRVKETAAEDEWDESALKTERVRG
jgi:hypothetical protein